MKNLLSIGITLCLFFSSFLLAQDKIIVRYSGLLKQYEYYDFSGVILGTSKYNDLLEETEHFDASGKRIGETKYNNLLKEFNTYNSSGEKEYTTKYNSLLEEYEQYDKYGKKVGTTKYNKLLKQYDIYDAYNRKIGEINFNFEIGSSDIPSMKFVETTYNKAFGILLLPSIRKIAFNPNHKKIKKIKYLDNLSEEKQKKEGWIKSK